MPDPPELVPPSSPWRIVGIYVLFAGAWIAGSDWILAHAMPGAVAGLVATAKGALFLIITAVLLYGLVSQFTARARAREEYYRRLALAVEQAVEGIVITDGAARIMYVNPAFERITGYTRQEVMGANPRILKGGRHDARFYDAMWSTLRNGDAWTGRITNRRKDGTLYQAEEIISPLRDAGGVVQHYVAVQRDITRETQLEDQLRQAQKLEVIGQLTSGIAHDFNNILAIVIANTELMGAALPPGREDLRSDLAELRAAALTGAVVVKKLLGVSRRAALAPVATDLRELMADLTTLIRRVLPANILIETDATAPLAVVRVDPGAVQQIVLNLVTNARDAMPDGGTVRVTVRPADDAAFVCLSVADSGVGMDERTRARVFEPFFTTKPTGKGTGLGMAMVHGLVTQHGGWIDVDSEPGRGTTIRIGLPVDTTAPGAAAHAAPSQMQGGNETILVAEDEPALRRSACKLLERLGYRVLAAEDGQEAVELCRAQEWRVDLVVADGQMPRLSGVELYEILRREAPRIRFLLASGYRVPDETVPVRVATIPFLPKPWTLAELAASVRETLDLA